MSLNRSPYPDLGKVHTLTGAAIATAYGAGTASNPIEISGVRRARFFVHVVTVAGSLLTTINVKLKARYVSADGAAVLGYRDIPSNLDDAQGAAQPKGPTLETEHAFTVSANAAFDFGFYLDSAAALTDVAIDVKANAAGSVGDTVDVYARVG